ncbi:hypothetical protein V0288_00295 [Pannus brasiliensis CCIBt3594]|uniref:Uncharacterized protein n=1 Tax=Pannus brasiliensis CCIBt3594 TaxID=1427578 RepID=A0AAW9QQJ0_9CHRO
MVFPKTIAKSLCEGRGAIETAGELAFFPPESRFLAEFKNWRVVQEPGVGSQEE